MKLKICFRLHDNDNLFPIQFTRSIAARLRALFAEVLLTIVGCGVDEVVEADALLEGVLATDGAAVAVVAVEAAVEFEVVAAGTPDVADKMRYIKAFAVNLLQWRENKNEYKFRDLTKKSI